MQPKSGLAAFVQIRARKQQNHQGVYNPLALTERGNRSGDPSGQVIKGGPTDS